MPRLSAAALAALLALPGAVRAQETAPEADPKVQAAIQKAVDKAKEELRNEMRAELQGAQSAAEFMGAVSEQQPRAELVELDGYFRVRGQVLGKLNLRNSTDSAGFYYYPKPIRAGSTLSQADMRLRLEPTINASETVRVRTQIDVLDNYVLGSGHSAEEDSTGTTATFYGAGRVSTSNDVTEDRDPVIARRVWGEVQTPVGLLSFGRMPSDWGLGIMANAGTGLDQDYGDTVDRIQFALPPVSTPVGDLVLIPIWDFDAQGVLRKDPHGSAGYGQPLDADNGDDGRTLALKLVRLDTPDEIRRKLDRGEHSLNFGLYYNHRTQRYVYPAWIDCGSAATCTDAAGNTVDTGGGDYSDSSDTAFYKRRGARADYASFWLRWLGPKLRVETELVGMTGHVGNANAGSIYEDTVRSIHMRQLGAVLQTEYKVNGRFSWGVEAGGASGDSAPGFGNDPTRGRAEDAAGSFSRPNYGAIEGPQWGRPGDNSINNYRFNKAYHTDLIFYRRILGQITDSVYLKPNMHWQIIPGLTLDTGLLYAQAMTRESTPSSASVNSADTDSPLDPAHKGKRPLALELDNTLTFSPTKAFTLWSDLGFLKPLSGMGTGTSMAWMWDFGLAARF